jgi:hypothetical protein
MTTLPQWILPVLLLSLFAAVWAYRWWRTNRSRREKLVLFSVLAAAALVALVSLHPFSTAADCMPMAGLEIHAQVDAHDDGYLLPADSGLSYFRHGVHDLVQGRIAFFEIERASRDVGRYRLASAYHPACIERSLHDRHLAGLPLPAMTCVAVTQHPDPVARYQLEGYPLDQQPPKSIRLRDPSDGRVLARYQRPGRGWEALSWRRNAACSQNMRHRGHPSWNLSSFVFRDARGKTFDARQHHLALKELGAPQLAADVLPPPDWVRRDLAHAGRLAPDHCHLPGWYGNTEVHEITLDKGPLEVTAQLDASGEAAGVVLLDVHVPDKAVVIVARARGPTIWHIHESSRSSVVAVLVQAEHGQAVVGLTRYSRILLSTRLHNPYTNCTATELGEIVSAVSEHYGITQSHSQPKLPGRRVVRYELGEAMPAGGELFHHDRSLSEFELRAE